MLVTMRTFADDKLNFATMISFCDTVEKIVRKEKMLVTMFSKGFLGSLKVTIVWLRVNFLRNDPRLELNKFSFPLIVLN